MNFRESADRKVQVTGTLSVVTVSQGEKPAELAILNAETCSHIFTVALLVITKIWSNSNAHHQRHELFHLLNDFLLNSCYLPDSVIDIHISLNKTQK